MRTTIAVQGARVHNLKNISVEIPRQPGGGHGTLRLGEVEPCLRHHLRRGPAPLHGSRATPSVSWRTWPADVDFVFGLSPVISIEQKTVASNPDRPSAR